MTTRVKRLLAACLLAAGLVAAGLAVVASRGHADTLILSPIADTYVRATHADTNYGSEPSLRVDGAPPTISYLKFDVVGMAGAPVKVSLKVFKPPSTTTAITLRSVADVGWSESEMTYDNRPTTGIDAIVPPKPWTSDTWLIYDVTALVGGNGHVSFALDTTSASSNSLPSREEPVEWNRPQLVIDHDAAPTQEPLTTPPSPTGGRTAAPTPTLSETATPGPDTSPVIAAVGDLACAPGFTVGSDCQHQAVSDKILADPTIEAFLALGDLQYDKGSPAGFQQAYDPTYGRFKDKTKPVPGNHEYGTRDASGYFTYFGALAGDPAKGYYSFDLGDWHWIALNSERDISANGAQVAWLKADLAAHSRKCVGAYWHKPRFSTGEHGDYPTMAPFFQALYDANAELVLSGHDHDYERFHPLNPNGDRDDARGVVQLVSGNGGKNHYIVEGGPTTAAKDNITYGYTRIRLNPTSAELTYVAAVGTYSDAATITCH